MPKLAQMLQRKSFVVSGLDEKVMIFLINSKNTSKVGAKFSY
jgi:hypothetical protein